MAKIIRVDEKTLISTVKTIAKRIIKEHNNMALGFGNLKPAFKENEEKYESTTPESFVNSFSENADKNDLILMFHELKENKKTLDLMDYIESLNDTNKQLEITSFIVNYCI